MTEPRAIGGVMPAEASSAAKEGSLWRLWSEGASAHAAFVNARSALSAYLEHRRARRVWLPSYGCAALLEGASAAGREVKFYRVDAALEADVTTLSAQLAAGDAVVVIDHFGRPPGEAWRAAATAFPDLAWIEDRAQALDTASPPLGQVRLYSPRKLVGVGDGGLLFGDAPLPAPRGRAQPAWAPEDARALDPDGGSPEAWYDLFQAREQRQPVCRAPAGPRTLAALAAIEARPIAEARRANWRRLAEALGDYALWPVMDPAFTPLAFPILVEDAAGVVARLASERIWAPRHWRDPPSPPADFPEAHWLAAHCVSLPLDQRYGASDMGRVSRTVRSAATPAGAR